MRSTIPERRLWIAVIHQAIEDMDSPRRELAVNAHQWFRRAGTRVRGLGWICDMLDLDMDKIQELVVADRSRRQFVGRSA